MPAHWNKVQDDVLNVGFFNPVAWGTWSLTETPAYQEGDEAITEMSFSTLDSLARYPEGEEANVNVVFRRYDDGEYRYEQVCDDERSVDLCDVMKPQDMLEEKEAFIANATHTIGGEPATLRDFYDVPSGYMVREAKFYTTTHRVRFTAIYDVGDILTAHESYNSEVSLFDIAKEILGEKLADPINRFIELYPNETQEMRRFYDDVDRVLESVTFPR